VSQPACTPVALQRHVRFQRIRERNRAVSVAAGTTFPFFVKMVGTESRNARSRSAARVFSARGDRFFSVNGNSSLFRAVRVSRYRPRLQHRYRGGLFMKKLLLTAAAAAVLFAGPAVVASAASAAPSYQVAQVELNIGDHDRDRDRDHRRVIVREHRRCENVTIRRHRPDGSVVIRKERRCH
jgi:hypothetical protein